MISPLSINNLTNISSVAQAFTLGDWIWILLFVLALVLVWWLLSRSTKQSTIEAQVLQTQIAEEHKAPHEIDDLTKIEGIGPKISALLQEAGITTFEALGNVEGDQIKDLLNSAGITIADPTTWPDQARLAETGNWEALEEYQDQLKAGRLQP